MYLNSRYNLHLQVLELPTRRNGEPLKKGLFYIYAISSLLFSYAPRVERMISGRLLPDLMPVRSASYWQRLPLPIDRALGRTALELWELFPKGLTANYHLVKNSSEDSSTLLIYSSTSSITESCPVLSSWLLAPSSATNLLKASLKSPQQPLRATRLVSLFL